MERRGGDRRKACSGLVLVLLAVSLLPGSSEARIRRSSRIAETSPSVPICLSSFQTEGVDLKLKTVLDKAALYCRRLEKAALDFVCLEEITEEIDHSRERADGAGRLKNVYLYDFQFVRKNDLKREARTLISKNGRTATVKDEVLLTSTVRVEYVLFGPVGLLGENWQPRRAFRILGEDVVFGEPTVILESRMRPGMEGRHCDGRAWVRESDGSVLRIEWDQSTLGGIDQIEERARMFKAQARMTSITEYGFEKNGLRFPSLDMTEEAYVTAGHDPFLRARTVIRYKDYRFFTVETKTVVTNK